MKSLKLVDDIAHVNSENADAVFSNDIVHDIQRMKQLKFSTEK